MTTSTTTFDEAMAHLRGQMNASTLHQLIEIALEGEDMGDAPWAAANVIAEYPAELLALHETELRQLASEQWVYLNQPAKLALAKIAAA